MKFNIPSNNESINKRNKYLFLAAISFILAIVLIVLIAIFIRQDSKPTHDEIDNHKVYENMLNVSNDYLSSKSITDRANKINSFTSEGNTLNLSLSCEGNDKQIILSINTLKSVDFNALLHELNEDNVSSIKNKSTSIEMLSGSIVKDSIFATFTPLLVKVNHSTSDTSSPIYGSGILKQDNKLISFTNVLRNEDKTFTLTSGVSSFNEETDSATYNFVKYISEYIA